ITWPLVNPAAGYRTFSRLVSFRCLPWMSTVDDSLMTAPFSPTGRVFSIVATPYAMRLDARTAQFDNPPCAHVTSDFPFAFGPNLHWRLDEIPRVQNPAPLPGAFHCGVCAEPCFFRDMNHGQETEQRSDGAPVR